MLSHVLGSGATANDRIWPTVQAVRVVTTTNMTRVTRPASQRNTKGFFEKEVMFQPKLDSMAKHHS